MELTVDQFKGMNTRLAPTRLNDDECYLIQNMDVNDAGYLSSRRGFAQVGSYSASSSLNKMYGVIGAIGSEKIFYSRPTTGNYRQLYRIQLDGTNDTSVGSAIQYLEWGMQVENDFYFCSSDNVTPETLYKYDGTLQTLSALTGTPLGTHMAFQKSRMWMVNSRGVGSARDDLLYTDVLDYTSTGWSGNSITIKSGDGDPLVAVVPYSDYLIIFKSSSTHILYNDAVDPGDWVLREIHPTIGCICRDTVVIIDNLLYFEAADGVFRTDGTSFEEVSHPIRDAFVSRALSSTTYGEDYAVAWESKYILFATGSNRVWCYDFRVDGWTKYDLGNYSVYGTATVESESPGSIFVSLYDTGGTTSYFAQFGDPSVNADMGGTIAKNVKSKFFDFGVPSKWKRGTNAVVDYVNEDGVTASFHWIYDDTNTGSTDTVAVSTTVAEDTGRTTVPVSPPGWFRSVQFQFQQTGDAVVNLYGVTVDLKEQDLPAKVVG